ncbi:MAG: hypothetical protein GVY15_05225 [Bacteroidetes bacterium]|jgi:hypothetical protein|nr:hypothetical protein [Bacteroidota bacterium]
MAYRYRIDPTKERGVLTLHGAVTAAHIDAALCALTADATWQPGFDTLWDCRRIKKLVVEWDGARQVMQRLDALTERRGPGRAAVVAHRAVDESVAQLFRATSSTPQREIRLFRSMKQALAWLESPDSGR